VVSAALIDSRSDKLPYSSFSTATVLMFETPINLNTLMR
jgi:hypothetical protein